jgi:hypothetical protein
MKRTCIRCHATPYNAARDLFNHFEIRVSTNLKEIERITYCATADLVPYENPVHASFPFLFFTPHVLRKKIQIENKMVLNRIRTNEFEEGKRVVVGSQGGAAPISVPC